MTTSIVFENENFHPRAKSSHHSNWDIDHNFSDRRYFGYTPICNPLFKSSYTNPVLFYKESMKYSSPIL